MNDEERIHTDKEFYVNQATLELLKLRIESDVKANFFRWIGLPVGGAGIVAILLTIFGWIPGTISTVIEENPRVQKILDDSTINYMKDPEGGQKYIQEQIEISAQKQVVAITNSFLDEKGEKLVNQLVDEYLKSDDVTKLLRDSIDKALSPKIGALSDEIRKNATLLIAAPEIIGMILPESADGDPGRVAKGSLGQLDRFLKSSKAKELKEKKTPLVLTMNIQKGPRYAPFAIKKWIRDLGDMFGEYFQYAMALS